MMRKGQSGRHVPIPPPGMEISQLAIKLEWKKKWRDRRQLAIINNYHLPRKNASFDNIIWHGYPWGERFQMAVVGGRQVTGWNDRDHSDQKVSL